MKLKQQRKKVTPLKPLLSNSYKETNKQDTTINGLIRDDKLSGKHVQVFINP
jgi:hypothetical protein